MQIISRIFGTSWKTSLSGYLGAIAVGVIPVLQTGQVSEEALIMAAAVAVLGRFAKDHNVTGGK